MEPGDVVSQLEGVQELSDSRRKRRVTIVILLVTLSTSGVGYLAGRAGSNSQTAARLRHTHTLAGQRAQLDAIAERATVNDVQDDIGELSWATTVRTYQGIRVTDPAESARIAADKTLLTSNQTGLETAYPEATGDFLAFFAEGNKDANREQQLAAIAAEQGAAWGHRADAYVSVIGLFAVALFLLGLSLTVQRTRLFSGFLLLGLALWATALGWAGLTSRTEVPDTNTAAIEAYVDGRAELDRGKPQEAVSRFAEATRRRQDYAEAWSALGLARARTGPDGLRESVADFRRAIRHGRRSASDYSNLATAEALGAGDTDAGLRSIEQAIRLDDDQPLLHGTHAEVLLAAGDEDGARKAFARAVELIRDRGPVFRDVWFASARADFAALPGTKASAEQRDRWTRLVRETEASLDSLGQPGPSAGSSGAAVRSVRVVTKEADATLSFDYTGIEPGSKVSLRLYAGGQLDRNLSVRKLDWTLPADGHAERGPFIAPAVESYDVEVYVDGNLVFEGLVPVTAAAT
jgi:tetratricopeptide (TPR) repeat protein